MSDGPIIFALACEFPAYNAIVYKPLEALSALAVLVRGLPIDWISQRRTDITLIIAQP
jgi:hypothetical protein